MSERSFRIIQGSYLLLALYFGLDVLVLAYLVLIAFEGLTNWRIPLIVNRFRYGKLAVASGPDPATDNKIDPSDTPAQCESCKFNFEAERLLRIVVFVLLIFTVLIFPEPGWFFPWFIGAMFLMAGLTNICPMVLLFRYLGFR
jgi:hypothetical protein